MYTIQSSVYTANNLYSNIRDLKLMALQLVECCTGCTYIHMFYANYYMLTPTPTHAHIDIRDQSHKCSLRFTFVWRCIQLLLEDYWNVYTSIYIYYEEDLVHHFNQSRIKISPETIFDVRISYIVRFEQIWCDKHHSAAPLARVWVICSQVKVQIHSKGEYERREYCRNINEWRMLIFAYHLYATVRCFHVFHHHAKWCMLLEHYYWAAFPNGSLRYSMLVYQQWIYTDTVNTPPHDVREKEKFARWK